jgi:hypothetical protein
MGYNMYEVSDSVHIKQKSFAKALDIIKSLMGHKEGQIKDSSGYHFSWVDTNRVLRAKTLEEALKAWRWAPRIDEGDIVGLEFKGEKLGDDFTLFQAIAPFVEDGSFIEMRGEDGAMWKWSFNYTYCRELAGHTVYEED